MLTARAEYRLQLRADNAETRLGPIGLQQGVIGAERQARLDRRREQRKALDQGLAEVKTATQLASVGANVKLDGSKRTLFEWARFPEISDELLLMLCPTLNQVDKDLRAEILEDARYAPYLERQAAEIDALRRDERVHLPLDMDFRTIGGLSAEMIERLEVARPDSLAAASRIRGITPAALAAILVHSRRVAA